MRWENKRVWGLALFSQNIINKAGLHLFKNFSLWSLKLEVMSSIL